VKEAGVQAHPQKFWFVENPGKNGAQRFLILKNCAQRLQKNTSRPFLLSEVIPKKGLHDLRRRQFVGKTRTKTFWASLRKFGRKSFAPPAKFCLLPHLWIWARVIENASTALCKIFMKISVCQRTKRYKHVNEAEHEGHFVVKKHVSWKVVRNGNVPVFR